MLSREQIVVLMGNANIKAMQHVIREGETDQTDRAYYRVNGKPDLISLERHPYDGVTTTLGGRASGAYQDLGTTWAGIRKRYPEDCKDFSQYAQDFGSVVGMNDRGALQSVLDGDLVAAIELLKEEWISLKGLGQRAFNVFQQYGGSLNAASSPPAAQPEKSMGPLALLSLIAQFVPQIATLIKPNSQSTARDSTLAQTILNTVVSAAGIVTGGGPVNAAQVGAAVDAMGKDATLAAKVQQAVVSHPDVIGVLQIGDGIKGARDFGVAVQVADKPFWFNPTFWISVAFFPMMYMIAYSVLFTVAPDTKTTPEMMTALSWYQKIGFDPNTRSGLVNLIVGFVFGGVVGVWFGTSYGSQRKTELAAQKDDAAI